VKVVDTSVFVGAERANGPAVERIAELLGRGELVVSVVTVFELTRGRTTPARRLAHYAELFGREAAVLPVTHAASQLAAAAARLAAHGIKAPDALIAGTALEHGAAVVASDADFLRIPGLAVEWVPQGTAAHEPAARYRAAGGRVAIAARIRELRRAANLRPKDVAEATGMARSNYARLEAGRHEPSLDTLLRVADALRAPVAELLG
jgi:predicted nucleic acid-binding protein/DNA-binding XRE family transcriptional regulator